MYTQETLIGIGIACVVGGIILGLVGGRFLLRSKHAATLERELEEAQEALKNYKNDVFQQFGDTARKFEKLNESYADLHQQLATSASVLCADMPNLPLISSSTVAALQPNEEPVVESVVDSVEETIGETIGETEATVTAQEDAPSADTASPDHTGPANEDPAAAAPATQDPKVEMSEVSEPDKPKLP